EVPVFANKVKPVETPDAARIARLLADLDSEEFARRQQAERELSQLDELVEPELRKAAAESTSPEVRRRAEALLSRLDASPPPPATIQTLRAIEVLERLGTKEAREL